MSNGKRVLKSDVVILSIKPQRPEFTPDKKLVPVRIALQEWDKLDAYYRGQILKLKNKVKTTELRKSGKSSAVSNNSCKKSVSRRSSTSGHQLTELFGDENVPFSNENEERASDEENRRPKAGERHRSSSRKHRDSKKSEKIKSDPTPNSRADEDEENYLSVPRDNFVIEFAIGQKKRTPVHRPDLSALINPIKVEPYKPPVAIGFNGVHIQKILYHKSDGVQQTSPTTTVPTPEKPPNIDSTSQSPFLSSSSNGDNKSCNNQSKLSPENGKASFTDSPNVKDNSSNSITSTSLLAKRKSDKHYNGINGFVSTSTTINSNSSESCHMEISPKKAKKFSTPINNEKNNSHSPISSKPCLSITDKIIKKAKELPPELKERERRRKLESQKRQAYSKLKTHEQILMDSVDVSMKAMEMIWNPPLLSPIRSP